MARKPSSAVILAAGMGTRLRDLFSGLPKGFVQIGSETLIERSLRLLGEHGIEHVLIVAGHLGDAYHDLAKAHPAVRVIDNPDYAETGSMASLALALEEMDQDFLLLESDLFYEDRALSALLEGDTRDVLLASGPTGATDEVWIESDQGRLTAMSKDREELDEVSGELVGIMRVSSSLASEWLSAFKAFVREHGHGRMAYETDGLVQVAQDRPVEVRLVSDLLWGEVDYEHHYLRVRDEVEPLCARRESGRAPDSSRTE